MTSDKEVTQNKEKYNSDNFVHLYIALQRKKDNSQNNQKICFRQIIKDNEFLDLEILKLRCSMIKGTWRIYKTINKRDTSKAKKLLLKYYIDNPDCNIEQEYKNHMLTPACKGENKFLLDIDDKEIYKDIITILHNNNVKIEDIKQTPNGNHIVVNKFDTRILEQFLNKGLEIKKDAYIFIEIYEAK